MPRKPRQDYAGAWHHVMNRGIAGGLVYRDDADCLRFLEAIGDTVDQFGIEVHAYALMPNHYHLLLRSVRAELSRSMRQLGGTYTQATNRRWRRDGPLFRGRFKSVLVTRDDHLTYLLAYLHLNPIRARLVRRITDECWTSHRAYVGLETPPPWLTHHELTRRLGGRKAVGRWVSSLRVGRERWPEDFDAHRTVSGPADEGREERRTSVPAGGMTAAQVLRRVTALTGASPKRLRETAFGPRANPARRFAVWALVRSAGLTHRQAARELKMSAGQVANTMSRFGRTGFPEPIDAWVSEWQAEERGE